MSRPSEEQIRDQFRQLRRLNIDELEAKTIDALRRATTPGPARDGYPGGTSNPGSHSSSELTSVEAAADHRAFKQPELDQLADHTEHAISFLYDGVGALNALAGRMERIDKLSNLPPAYETAGTGHCQACSVYCSGALDDRLRAGYCDACRKAWQRAGFPDRFAFEHERAERTRTPGSRRKTA